MLFRSDASQLEWKRVFGGVLIQEPDLATEEIASCPAVTQRKPSEDEMRALAFNWNVAKHVKSNAIVFADARGTLGIGAGQMSRVDSSKLAIRKASDANMDLKGSVAASDGFFPFADGLLAAVEAGATSVIQPGGSMRDDEVITAADEAGLAMVMTGMRHFRH